jgi:hypothetical protein
LEEDEKQQLITATKANGSDTHAVRVKQALEALSAPAATTASAVATEEPVKQDKIAEVSSLFIFLFFHTFFRNNI